MGLVRPLAGRTSVSWLWQRRADDSHGFEQ